MKRIAALHAGARAVDATALLPFLAGAPTTAALPANQQDMDRRAIIDAWNQARGNKSRVAELLGVSRKTLYARLRRLNVTLH
jgi:transcriptional regulator of acetoin/glycerol metabolism